MTKDWRTPSRSWEGLRAKVRRESLQGQGTITIRANSFEEAREKARAILTPEYAAEISQYGAGGKEGDVSHVLWDWLAGAVFGEKGEGCNWDFWSDLRQNPPSFGSKWWDVWDQQWIEIDELREADGSLVPNKQWRWQFQNSRDHWHDLPKVDWEAEYDETD